jgi:type IV pilus assembly protein PilM
MTDRPTASQTLGLEIDERELRAVQLISAKGKPALSQIIIIPIEHDPQQPGHVKPLYTEITQKKFQSISDKSLIITAVASSDVLVRELNIQLIKEKDIDDVLEFQSEPLLPYSSDEAIIDRIVINKGLENTELTICAVKSEHLSAYLQTWHEVGIEPEVISCDQAALATFSKQFSSIDTLHYVLHIGHKETTIILSNDGKLLYSQACRHGTNELFEAFAHDTGLTEKELETGFSRFNFNGPEMTNYPTLLEAFKTLQIEITKRLFSLAKQYPGQEIETVLVTGHGAALNLLPEALNQALGKKIHYPKTSSGFNLTPMELRRFAIPLGLALSALPKATHNINFRQKDFVYPYPWKRIKKPIGIYLSLCLAFSLTLLFLGNAYITSQEDGLRKKYLNVLTLMKKPFQEVEKEIESITPSATTFSNEKGKPIIEMTQADMSRRLSILEKELKESPNVFPLQPNTPRVSDVLAWFSTHPHFTELDPESGKPKIQLESFSYRMVKLPEFNKPRERYQARVEIEFSSLTPRYAREFHDILLAPNELVDPSEDVKWSTERGRYRASFFLKDKTIYPSARR